MKRSYQQMSADDSSVERRNSPEIIIGFTQKQKGALMAEIKPSYTNWNALVEIAKTKYWKLTAKELQRILPCNIPLYQPAPRQPTLTFQPPQPSPIAIKTFQLPKHPQPLPVAIKPFRSSQFSRSPFADIKPTIFQAVDETTNPLIFIREVPYEEPILRFVSPRQNYEFVNETGK